MIHHLSNPWHIVDIGGEAPDVVFSVIEVPKGSKNKYELDKKTGLLKLDRVLFSAVHYPANYGFIPQTYCEDQDPLDILVLGQEPVHPLCIIESKAIGVIRMIDHGLADDKIIAVNVNDPEYCNYDDIDELPSHKMKEIKRFFLDYKLLEGSEVTIEGFLDHSKSRHIITDAAQMYKDQFQIKGNS